jgi:6-phosphogluconolactonase
MMRALIYEQMVWERLHVVQIDECIAPISDEARNLPRLREGLLEYSLVRPQQIHAMPVEAWELDVAAARYALSLHRIAGTPPVLDLAYLSLREDGCAASLFPGDPVLDVTDQDVALTNVYKGHRWMTFTYPILNRTRFVLWSVTGAEQAKMLVRLGERDESITAGRVRGCAALILADRAAAGEFTPYERAV